MPVSKEQLESIIGRARGMCSSENDRMLNEMAGRANINPNRNYFEDPDPNSFNDGGLADSYEALLGYGNESPQPRDIRYNAQSAARSKMPEKIKQSMLAEQIDVTKLGNTSVLDSLNIPQQKQQSRSPINETKTYAAPQSNQQIDYSIIKAIVSECIENYFSKMPLNESAGIKTIGLSKGYISIVDNKGDIYKAKLEKVGNKNDIE